MSEQLTGFCPNCGNKLVYGKNESTVTCYACDSVISVEEFSSKSSSSVAGEGFGVSAMMPAMMMGFDNPESGVVFVENFFENYDWVAYAIDADIVIPEIAEVVKNNKMKNGACAVSWYLDYKALAYPVRKKIEGLAQHQKEMAELYNPVDPTAALDLFDSYRNICVALKKAEKDIFKQLETAIKYAEKFALEAAKLSEIKNDLADLKALFEKEVVWVKEINEIPAYVEASKAASREIAAQLAEKGINAEEVYASAVAQYNDGTPNKSVALAKFESIRGYEDSVNYIKKINQYFNFNDEVYRAFGKHFIYKEEDYAPTLDLKNLAKNKGCSAFKKKDKNAAAATPAEDAPQAVKALALYEIVDGKPAKEATVKGITKILTCYGGRLYYIKSNAGIHCLDIYTKAETCICKGKDEDFKNDKGNLECKLMSNGSSFYMVKLFKEEKVAEVAKKGCAAFKKDKKGAKNAAPVEDHKLNPYCVVLVDMKNNTCKSVIKELVEFERNYGDKIFYYYAYKPEVAKSGCMSKFKKVEEPEAKKRLMVCDIIKGTNKEISEDCQLYAVSGDYIIYSFWKPNQYNKDLHAFNLETNQDVILEKNIYNFFKVIDGKVYYTVGNAAYSPLVRIDLDGSNRIEIMPNVENIIGERGGWLYVQKGRGNNAILAKISNDGKDFVIICTQVSQYVRLDGNYLYYVDIYNNLRVVRIDGKYNRKLAENVHKIFPCEEGLYYTRNETVAAGETALSLYLMDRRGRNIKKMVFNVDYVQNDPTTNTLYHSKTENLRFKVYLPKQEDKATYEFHKITKYSILDKATGESKLFLTIGWPEGDKQTGCLKKKKVNFIYEEAPIRPTYERESIADTTEAEDTTIEAPAKVKLPGCIPEKSGCAKILTPLIGALNKGGKTNLPNKGGKQSAKTKLFSMKSTKSAAKSTSSAKSTKAMKFDPKLLVLGLVVYALLFLGIMMLVKRTNHYYMGHGFIGMLWPVLIGVACAVIALALLGIIPLLNLKAMKGSKVIAIFYVLTALVWIATGFVGMSFGSASSSSDGAKQNLYLNQVTYIELDSNETAEYQLYVSEGLEGEYTLTVYDNNYTVKVDYTSGTLYMDYNQTETIHLNRGYNYFYISFENSDYNSGFSLEINKSRNFAENATKVVGLSSANREGFPVQVDSYTSVWFEFVAPQDGNYYFSLDDFTYAYLIGYSDENASGNPNYGIFSAYVNQGESYFIEVVGNDISKVSVDFKVTGEGLSKDDASALGTYFTYNKYLAQGGYLWLTFNANAGSDYNLHVYAKEGDVMAEFFYENDDGSLSSYSTNGGYQFDWQEPFVGDETLYVIIYANADTTLELELTD